MSTAVDTDKATALATAANEARGLAMDSIAAAHSGHMGLPLGAAEIGAVLWGSQVRKIQRLKVDASVVMVVDPFSHLDVDVDWFWACLRKQ